MSVSTALIDEIAILNQFNLDSMQSGIKVHTHSATPASVAAVAPRSIG